MRRAHFLTPNAKREAPGICIYFDTETLPRDLKNGDIEQVLLFGWACYRRKQNGQWGSTEWLRFEKRSTFWDWVISKIRDGQKVFLYAHNLNFDASVLGMLGCLTDRGFTLADCMIDDPPTMFRWVKKDANEKVLCTLQLVDTFNYFPFSLEKIGDNMGIAKLKMPDFQKATQEESDTYCKRDVDVICVAMERLQEFVDFHDMGNFALTQAGQSFNAFRHRFMNDHSIFIDSNPEALQLARASYYGGRVEAFHIGKLNVPIYKLDVNSMYPYVMRENVFPVKLVSFSKDVSISGLERAIEKYGVCADVVIRTDKPYFPKLQDKRLIFPTGRFPGQYATPELKFALQKNLIEQVNSMAVYEVQPVFKGYIDYFYGMRQKATKEGRTEESYLLKIAMNSLYGKFGQNGRKWKTIDETPEDDYEVKVWQEIDAQTGEETDYRQIGSAIQRLDKEDESLNSFPAIAATITSYARMLLLEMILTAGWDHVFYCDTDCLFVNATGYERLKNRIDPTILGMLKNEGVSGSVIINGLKDYVFDGHAKLKGIRHNARQIRPGVYEQEKWERWQGKVRNGRMDQMVISKITKHVTGEYTKGKVLANGKVIPFALG